MLPSPSVAHQFAERLKSISCRENGFETRDQKGFGARARIPQERGLLRRQRRDVLLLTRVEGSAGHVKSDKERMKVQNLQARAEESGGVCGKIP